MADEIRKKSSEEDWEAMPQQGTSPLALIKMFQETLAHRKKNRKLCTN